MRFQRTITLQPSQADQPEGPPEFEFYDVIERENYRQETHRYREGLTLHCKIKTSDQSGDCTKNSEVSWSRSCLIPYSKIHAACEVVVDDDVHEPWEDCDLYAHEVITEDAFMMEIPGDNYERSFMTRQRGYPAYHTDKFIRLADSYDDEERWHYEYYRRNGASKQVAAELCANKRQQLLDQLVKWHADDGHWEFWGVKCDFSIGDDSYEESVWGIDDYKYADAEATHEIADEVVWALERDGYIVTDKPDYKQVYYESRREVYQYHMNQFNWK